jgi:organic hydroperoxide reductase OsmC/OhrA
MRWFLALAQRQKLCVESYRDSPEGVLEVKGLKQPIITKVMLHPEVRFRGPLQPDDTQVLGIHAAAHAQCKLSSGIEIVVCHAGARIGGAPEVLVAL